MTQQQKLQYSGEIKPGTRKRLIKCIDILCQSIKTYKVRCCITGKMINHRLSFITLTISSQQNITASEGYKKAFVHFIQWLRRTKKVSTYVWKAEFQKRGQLHYHITTPSYIDYREIRQKWNALQKRAGWLNEYHNDYNSWDPNSTDIHEQKHIKNLSSYMIKEFIKSIQNQPTQGKIWDASQNLKKAKYYGFIESQLHNDLISELIEKNKVEVVRLEHCLIVRMMKQPTTSIMHLRNIQEYDNFLRDIRNYRKVL